MRCNSVRYALLSACVFLCIADATPPPPDRIAATVNGENITFAQLETAVRSQTEELDRRARQLRQTALNKLIDNLLLEQAARNAGMEVDTYLRRNVESADVTPAEVDQAYEQNRHQFPAVLPAEAKYRIRRTLEDNRRAAALNSLLAKLRSEARISNRLLDDRLALLDFAAQEGPALGEWSAPITIVEFADFECPYCRAAQPSLKRILKRWPGRIRLVFRHFPLEQHAAGLAAARAAVCADRQGRFWALHDGIFAATPPLDDAALRDAASGSGLNLTEFAACVASAESLERVSKDIFLGRALDVSGTPAFFLNRQPIASPLALEAAVAQILDGAR